MLDAGDLLAFLAEDEGVRSVALYLEDDGDAPRLCEALARCADRGVGVAVLKAGASAVGATAAATHTGAIAGDHRVFRALVEEAGAAWARDGHEVLELAKALACGRRARGRGVALVTCSGADCAVGGDEAERLGVELPPLGAGDRGAAARAAAERRDASRTRSTTPRSSGATRRSCAT